MDGNTVFELIKTFGLGGAMLIASALWLTRVLVPRLQDEATTARAQFLAALQAVEDKHASNVSAMIEECRAEKREILEALKPRAWDGEERRGKPT